MFSPNEPVHFLGFFYLLDPDPGGISLCGSGFEIVEYRYWNGFSPTWQEAKLALERSGAQFVSPEEFERIKAQQPPAQQAAAGA